MKMATSQLHSYVTKFISLWAEGQDATLHFNVKHGKASVDMHLELGEFKPVKNIISYTTICYKIHYQYH